MAEQRAHHRPIGYWLKRADALLAARIDEAQRANGLTRLGWQTLNVIRGTDRVGRAAIAESLRPFTDPPAANDTLSNLVGQQLASGSDTDGYVLTTAGETLYQRALASQQDIRQEAVAGITEAEYATTTSVLQQLVENLGREDGAECSFKPALVAWPGSV